tara:strand:- start:1408 stop:2166 length:759 start_codon:yes stop_codon:yes gene_type:complete
MRKLNTDLLGMEIVNKQLAEEGVRERREMEQEAPKSVLARAKEAALALQSVIACKPKAVIIRGEQYLEFESWQLLGQFYGVAVQTSTANPVEINGVRGAKAEARLYDTLTGALLGDIGAEAYCLEDEERWGDRPFHQLASMAQTRAGAKALRNRFAWVVVLAGYGTTPAEELVSEEKIKSQVQQQLGITDAQRRKIFASAKQMGYRDEEVKTLIKEKFGVEHTKELTKVDASSLIETIEKGEGSPSNGTTSA